MADFRRFKQRGEGTPSPSGKRDHTEHEKHECNKRNSGREEEQEEAERLVPPVVFAIHASPPSEIHLQLSTRLQGGNSHYNWMIAGYGQLNTSEPSQPTDKSRARERAVEAV